MTRPEQSVLDEIDALIAEQVGGGEPPGRRFPRCVHCGRDWHGLPVAQGGFAHVHPTFVCPGSDFCGPVRPFSTGRPGNGVLILPEGVRRPASCGFVKPDRAAGRVEDVGGGDDILPVVLSYGVEAVPVADGRWRVRTGDGREFTVDYPTDRPMPPTVLSMLEYSHFRGGAHLVVTLYYDGVWGITDPSVGLPVPDEPGSVSVPAEPALDDRGALLDRLADTVQLPREFLGRPLAPYEWAPGDDPPDARTWGER